MRLILKRVSKMERVAILIETSALGGNNIPGAQSDVTLLEQYLMSNIGGAWEQREIIKLHNPSYGEITSVVNNTVPNEYAFISYSGHGYHSEELDMTKVCTYKTNPTISYWMPLDELRPHCDKYLISIDCCRNREHDTILEGKKAAVEGMFAPIRRPYRRLFDNLVLKAEKGGIVFYSCDVQESAGETKIGGFFTRGLINAGKSNEPPANDNDMYLGIDRAFNSAYQYVQTRKNSQHPQAEYGRRLHYYPWAIYPNI